MAVALCRGIRKKYPAWKHLIDGDGGDENLKDYPIEENPELTIRSVVNNQMLYQEEGLQPLHPAGCGRGRRGHPVHRANQLRRRQTLRPQGRHRRPWNQISARVRNAGLRKAAFPTRGHLSRFASRKHPVSRRETAPKIPGALFLNPPIAPGWFTRRNRLPEAGGSSSDAVKRTHSIPPDLTLGYWKKSAPPRAGLLMGSPFS